MKQNVWSARSFDLYRLFCFTHDNILKLGLMLEIWIFMLHAGLD